MNKLFLLAFIAVIAVVLIASSALAMGNGDKRDATPPGLYKPGVVRAPFYENCTHRYSNIYLTISNFGFFGGMMESYMDCETGRGAPSCEFPAGSQVDYLYAAGLFVGAVVGADTLVSAGWDGWQWIYEMWPCAEPECGIQKRSNRPSDPAYDDSARADLEYIAQYTDTLDDRRWTETDWDGREHVPLDIQIIQTSYSWSVEYAQDFILIDYQFVNMGSKEYANTYVGLLVDGDVSHISRARGSYTDDICGFRETFPSRFGHEFMDTINLAWIADNDGDPFEGSFDFMSARGLTGIKVMRAPTEYAKVSFNWWTSNSNPQLDWGPMYEATRRNFGTGGLGTPEGDRAKYYMMSNGEQDYDQIFAAKNFGDLGWLPPSAAVGTQIAQGGDTRYLISFGPFTIAPRDTLPLTLAYIGGEDFHAAPDDYEKYMVDRYDPDGYYAALDFSDIARNSVWASWIYDNPGVDTDLDGFSGPTWEIEDTLPDGQIVLDTVYYAGDGVPDFRALAAPPSPVLRTSTTAGQVTLRWNGLITETFIDPFTKLQDFEGYRVYMGRLKKADQLALLESRDRFNFRRYIWDSVDSEWVAADNTPLTLDSLRQLHGVDFDPSGYECLSGAEEYSIGDTVYCFAPTGWNQSMEGWADGSPSTMSGAISKRFAYEIRIGKVTADLDSSITENWTRDFDPVSGDSVLYHKFYEYEFEIDNLLPSVPWYFSVTAFDFGGATADLQPLEGSPLANAVEVWAINDASAVLDGRLEVSVYPNPYIGDGRYVSSRYEDPNRTGFFDHERRVHFINLPPECTIKIFTLSGDLVREIKHPGSFSDTDSKAQWNVRSKNNEIVASGVYIYTIESRWGDQIGKLVIIL